MVPSSGEDRERVPSSGEDREQEPAPIGNFRLIDCDAEPIIESAPGNSFRVLADASKGSTCMSVVERWLEPGNAIALHTHPDAIEEVIWVRAGRAEFTVDGERAVVGPDQTVVIAPSSAHAIQSIGDEALWMFCRYSSATPSVLNESGETDPAPPWTLGY